MWQSDVINPQVIRWVAGTIAKISVGLGRQRIGLTLIVSQSATTVSGDTRC